MLIRDKIIAVFKDSNRFNKEVHSSSNAKQKIVLSLYFVWLDVLFTVPVLYCRLPSSSWSLVVNLCVLH